MHTDTALVMCVLWCTDHAPRLVFKTPEEIESSEFLWTFDAFMSNPDTPALEL